MAKIYGRGSKFISSGARRNAFWYIFFLFLFIVGLVLCFKLAGDIFGSDNQYIAWILLVPYLFLVFLLVKVFKYIADIDYFFRGMDGEEIIAKELEKLPESYQIFRNIRINHRKSDIDFIVVGPKGILTVEAKSHTGHITSDGRTLLKNGGPFPGNKNFLIQARKEAATLADYLRLYGFVGYIKPVVAFSSHRARLNFGLRSVDGLVYVVQKDWLLKLIYSLPDQPSAKLPQSTLEQILIKLVES
jgi:Nuclease-related domain